MAETTLPQPLTMGQVKDLSALMFQAVCPNNEILFDDLGAPSVMVKIPKMTYAQLGLGSSTDAHPAFIVNGQEVDAIYISKYMNSIQNGRAYSLPGRNFAGNINFNNALKACTDKGAGWHLMTAFEWGALIAWCEHNGFIPKGNCDYGKWFTENNYKAIPVLKDGSGNTLHTAVGTGPLEWYHDKSLAGIADLCGNGWEWTGGIRTVKGEVQIMTNNNAADGSNSQSSDSALWKAIKGSDGTLITPDGNGTTSGSVKMDWVDSALKYDTSITDVSPGEHQCLFKNIAYNSSNVGTGAIALLRALGMAPVSGSLITAYCNCIINNSADEHSIYRGGDYISQNATGFASIGNNRNRAYTHPNIGFRSAYVALA